MDLHESHTRAILAERERCAAIVRAKKPQEARLWWLRDELESLAQEIEKCHRVAEMPGKTGEE